MEWNDDGTPRRAVGTHLDITERKETEEALIAAKEKAEEMNRLKSAFLANMSHEIRTPLTAIIGFADVLSSQVDDTALGLLEMIRDSGKRLELTLTSVLDLAQLESHTMTLSPEWTDVGELAHNVARLFRTKTESHGVDLIVDTPAEAATAYVDPSAMQRILMNLIANAVKFTKQGYVRVAVDVVPDMDIVRIQVEDTGIGIPADRIETIFTEFTQASQGYTRDYEGSGLGLTISQELADLLGGSIEVESTEGEGSLFTVHIPRQAGDAEDDTSSAPGEAFHNVPAPSGSGTTPSDEEPKTASRRGPMAPRGVQEPSGTPPAEWGDKWFTVLLVEDNELTRDVLPLLIKETGAPFTVEGAATADEAFEKAKRTKYSLFLIDINLGTSVTGIDVMSALRDQPQYADTPMVACTAYAMPGDEEQFLKAGFDAYLAKPFRKDELVSVMTGMVHNAAPS
jgi:CheY-like chemotaxis protein